MIADDYTDFCLTVYSFCANKQWPEVTIKAYVEVCK
jgi:hypothetical protein